MKVSLNNLGINQSKSVAFKGYKPTKDDAGYKVYEFTVPFDPDKYDCYLELFEVETDENGNYIVGDIYDYLDPNNLDSEGVMSRKLNPGKNTINLVAEYPFSDMSKPIAYHYKGVPKNGGATLFKVDNGIIVDQRQNHNSLEDHAIYNVINQNGTNNHRGGSAKLFIVDTYKPGYVYNKNGKIELNEEIQKRAKNASRNFANKLGGNFAGVEKGLDDGDFDNYDYLISPPFFMSDSVSGHGYWNENCYQISPNLGNIHNYNSLQRKLFAKGKNLVTDGAFVNEGLQGAHFQDLIKWGSESYAFDWFKAPGIKAGPLSLGAFGKNTEFITHKIVNSPYAYRQTYDGPIKITSSEVYDKRKPTYIQVFDKRLANESEIKDSTKLIKNYEKTNLDNPLAINSHNDTMVNYAQIVNPETYNDNIIRLNEYNKNLPKEEQINMYSYMGTRILTKFENFVIDGKFEGGFDTWDANPDIAKLRFVSSNADTQESMNIEKPEDRIKFFQNIEQKNAEVQDYVVSAAKYWTRKTAQTLRLHVAQNLKTPDPSNPTEVYNQIMANINNGKFPQNLKWEINKNMVENVLNKKYNLKPLSVENFRTQLEDNLMDIPLESIELGNDIIRVLASPYMSKRATSAEDIGKTRSKLYAEGDPHVMDEFKVLYDKTTGLFTQDGAINEFAMKVLTQVNQELGAKRSLVTYSRDMTTYGKYVLPHIANEIVRYAVIKGLFPRTDVEIDNKTGEIIYDYEYLKSTSLNSLKIKAGSAEEEASQLIKKIKSGVNNLGNRDVENVKTAILKMLQGTNEHSFKLAEMIVDRSGAGLDWRIDATKDIADIEAMRDGNTDFDFTWKEITKFWTKFAQGVLEENPNAYMVAEVTDETQLFEHGGGKFSEKYNTPNFKDNGSRENPNNMEAINMKFLRESGITSVANYTYLFSTIANMFAKDNDDGGDKISTNTKAVGRTLYDKFVQPGMYNNYLKSMPLEALIFSYNFIGNHDKPRMLHCLAMDMGLFYTNLMDPQNHDYRVRAYRVMEDDHDQNKNVDNLVANYDFSKVNPKAIAAAETFRYGLINALNELAAKNKEAFKGDNHKKIYEAIGRSITDLARGKFGKDTIESETMGVNEYPLLLDVILKQAEFAHELKLSDADKKLFTDTAFRIIMEAPNSKLIGMQKYLAAMIGIPTLYAGDELGSTGYETKTKNIYVKNRGYLHNEWADENNTANKKDFIVNGKKEIDATMGIRTKRENHALNDGAPIMLKLQYPIGDEQSKQCPITAIFRQSTDGSMAISLFNPTGMTHDPRVKYKPHTLVLDSIGLGKDLDEYNQDVGLDFGIQPNTIFKNPLNDDKYIVKEYNGNYFIKKVDPHNPKNDLPVTINDSTLVLTYHPSFTGKVNKALVTNPYSTQKEIQTGKKLELIAK